jgi:hypothetical protein
METVTWRDIVDTMDRLQTYPYPAPYVMIMNPENYRLLRCLHVRQLYREMDSARRLVKRNLRLLMEIKEEHGKEEQVLWWNKGRV